MKKQGKIFKANPYKSLVRGLLCSVKDNFGMPQITRKTSKKYGKRNFLKSWAK